MKNSILKSKAFKLTSVLLAVLVLGVSIMAIVTNGFRNWGRSDVIPPVIDGGFVTDDKGNDLSDNEVHPMPKNMMFRNAAAQDEPVEIMLNATIEPYDAADQRVIWSVDWVDPNDTFAKGKNAASYLSVSPVEEYSLTATVSCFAPFGSQIVITVASVENPDATATCTVDYMRRLESLSLKVGASGSGLDSEEILDDGDTLSVTLSYSDTPGAWAREVSVVGNIGIGTVDDPSTPSPSIEAGLKVSLSEEFVAGLQDLGFPLIDDVLMDAVSPIFVPVDQSFVDSFFSDVPVAQRNAIVSLMASCDTAFDVTATFTNYDGVELSSTFHFHVDSQLGSFVTGITLDESTLVI